MQARRVVATEVARRSEWIRNPSAGSERRSRKEKQELHHYGDEHECLDRHWKAGGVRPSSDARDIPEDKSEVRSQEEADERPAAPIHWVVPGPPKEKQCRAEKVREEGGPQQQAREAPYVRIHRISDPSATAGGNAHQNTAALLIVSTTTTPPTYVHDNGTVTTATTRPDRNTMQGASRLPVVVAEAGGRFEAGSSRSSRRSVIIITTPLTVAAAQGAPARPTIASAMATAATRVTASPASRTEPSCM